VFLLFSQTLQNILKIFLKSLAQQKGIERNLLIKKFIKNILYSKEQIQINLYYTEDFDAFSNSILPYGVGVGGDKKEKGTSVSLSESPQFVLLRMAPRAGLEPATGWLQVIPVFPKGLDYLITLFDLHRS